jgi:hypothetical protein
MKRDSDQEVAAEKYARSAAEKQERGILFRDFRSPGTEVAE